MQVAANGQSLCRIEGAAAGPWVVLSHSLATNHHIWDDQVPALAGRYRILRYDVRGHGDSRASPGDYDFEQLGADVIALMDAHDIEKCHFIGISLGGMTALGLGINHGDRLHSISVCAAQAKIPEPPKSAFGDRIRAVLDDGIEAVWEGNLGRWFTDAYREQGGPAIEKSRQMVLATSPAGYAGCAAAIRGLDYLDRLGEINVPAIVIVGAQDPGTTPADAKQMVEGIRGARYAEIDPGAHNANMENPAAFNKALTEFLDAVATA